MGFWGFGVDNDAHDVADDDVVSRKRWPMPGMDMQAGL